MKNNITVEQELDQMKANVIKGLLAANYSETQLQQLKPIIQATIILTVEGMAGLMNKHFQTLFDKPNTP